MLTRLKLKGFKNLVDVDVRFGPLTCIAGLNGAGKSNLLDAIQFLSLLADRTFIDAARQVRGGEDPRAIFTFGGDGRMEMTAEMVIQPRGVDDFGQEAEASWTLLSYHLGLQLVPGDPARIRLLEEDLSYLTEEGAWSRLKGRFSKKWFQSVAKHSTRRTTFIKTEGLGDPDGVVVRLQSDRTRDETKARRGGGRATGFVASRLPRTVLSSAQYAEETRTAVLARQEMRAWQHLQLEPSALRRPDTFDDPSRVDPQGAHIPSTLNRLVQGDPQERVCTEVANRLAELVEGVDTVRVDKDEARRILRFMMKDRQGLDLPASSLSDGTLRFVALAVMKRDPQSASALCMEEPENGIHPQRMDRMVDLLYDISTSPDDPVNDTNPLRQVILTTHSPVVAGRVRPEDLLFVTRSIHAGPSTRPRVLDLLGLDGTWREKDENGGRVRTVPRGLVLEYLRGASSVETEPYISRPRVMDRFGQMDLFPEHKG